MAYEGESTVSTGTVAALERVVIARKTNQKNARLQTKGVNLIELSWIVQYAADADANLLEGGIFDNPCDSLEWAGKNP
jgi:hypothetical protein